MTETEHAPAPEPTFDTPADEAAPIVVALSRVMQDVGAVRKAEQASMGRGGNFKFRGVDTVVNAVSPALKRHGVVVLPDLLHVEYGTAPTSAGNVTNTVHVQVRYTFHGPLGDTLSTSVAAESFDSGDKATAKAMSVALRTAMLQALMLPTDDEDPDRESYQRGPDSPRREDRPPAALPPTPGQQRRQQGQQAAAAQGAPPSLPDAVALQYRDKVLNAVITYPQGPDRDTELRTINDQLSTIPGGPTTVVEVPEVWRNGKPPMAPLRALIGLARTASDPNDPWATPAPDGSEQR